MNAFGTLYRHHLRKLSAPYAFALMAFLVLSALIRWGFPLFPPLVLARSGIALLLLFGALPIIYSYSYKDDVLGRTDFQWLSIPTRRSTVVTSRFLAALTFLVISVGAAFLWSILMVPVQIQIMEELVKRTGSQDFARFIPHYNDFWGCWFNQSDYFFFIQLSSFCGFVLLGTVTFIQSLRYSFRLSGLPRNLLLLALFVAFSWFGLRGVDMGRYTMEIQAIMNSVAVGLAFFGTGLFLFERYAET